MARCDKHDEIMTRIFKEQEKRSREQAVFIERVTSFMERTENYMDKMDDIVFGNEKSEGLLTKWSNVIKHLNTQWALIILILTGLIGAGVALLYKGG